MTTSTQRKPDLRHVKGHPKYEELLAYRREWNRAYRLRCPEMRLASRLRTYGLTLAEYESMLAAQGGVCVVCQSGPSGSAHEKRLHVDHDHVTGRVRGLLCGGCNQALGYSHEDADRLRRLAAYVEAQARIG